MTSLSGRQHVAIGAAAVLLLTAASMAVVVGIGSQGGTRTQCTIPSLPGTLLNVTVTDMGAAMQGAGMHARGTGMAGGGAMRLTADRATVPAGTVTLLVANQGSTSHETLVLPLDGAATPGTRPVTGDAKVDETTVRAEASTSCGSGAGPGMEPGTSGWVTTTLTPGRYEVVCNLPGHYSAGMYTQLTVT